MNETVQLTPEMVWILSFLGLTIFLFVSEIVRVDVAAVIIMILVGLTGLIPGAPTLVSPEKLFSGFASNAVMAIIAVTILSKALDKTGLMKKLASVLLKFGGRKEKRIVPIISGTAGIISGFMQNIGAAALFISVVKRISLRTNIPSSRMLIPMGYCAILGGTLTLIGSSPLILLNDLLRSFNQNLPENVEALSTFNMFDVTPLGLALILSGVVYFTLFGRLVLPAQKEKEDQAVSPVEYFRKLYGIEGDIIEMHVHPACPFVGKTVSEVESMLYSGTVVTGLYQNRDMRISPAHDIEILPHAVMALLGDSEELQSICQAMQCEYSTSLRLFSEVLSPDMAGVSEVVIPPSSAVVGKTLQDFRMRKTHGTSVLAVHNRGGKVVREDLRELPLQAGDTLVLHSLWEDLLAMEKNPDFVVISSDFPHSVIFHQKLPHAIIISVITFALVIFSDLRLSISLMSGAIAMVGCGVLTMDEAYESVSWQSVFLLASLIPLGLAMESTGTAEWIAMKSMLLLGDVSPIVLQGAVAVLACAFTLLMSNVGATVLLVPLAINMALLAGANPSMFAMTVAISTSNSFLIPTHQVNALIMGPGSYRNLDFLRAGSIMTVLFLVVSLIMLNVLFS